MNAALRKLVRERAGFRCEYCLLLETILPVRHHVDHVIAQQHGGDSSPENLALARIDWKVQS